MQPRGSYHTGGLLVLIQHHMLGQETSPDPGWTQLSPGCSPWGGTLPAQLLAGSWRISPASRVPVERFKPKRMSPGQKCLTLAQVKKSLELTLILCFCVQLHLLILFGV